MSKGNTTKELKVLGNGVSEDGLELGCINITKEYAEVCDSRLLIRHKIESPAINVQLDKKKNVLIPADLITGREINVTIDDFETKALLVNGGAIAICKHNYELGEYPDTEKIYNTQKALPTVFKIGLSKSLLMKLLKSLPEGPRIEIVFEFKDPDKAVIFKYNNSEGMILPVKLDKENK